MAHAEGIPATQDQLKEIFDSTALHLPRLVPARREDNLPYIGPIPTEATTDPLFWTGKLSKEEVYHIRPSAVETLLVDRDLIVHFVGPLSLLGKMVSYIAPQGEAWEARGEIIFNVFSDAIRGYSGVQETELSASQAPPIQDDHTLLAELAQEPPPITFEQAEAMLAIARAFPNYTRLPEVGVY